MRTFDEMGLDPSLVEALAAEGIEEPTSLQAEAIPIIARGTSAVLRAGPGSGLLVTYAVPLLGRVAPGAGRPSVIVLSSDADRSGRLASTLSRFTAETGHVVGALGTAWYRPEAADVVFGTPADVSDAVASAALKLDGLLALVIETASALIADDADRIAGLVSSGPEGPVQIVAASDPISDQLRGWIDEHARRAFFLPPESARTEPAAAPTARGSLEYHVLDRPAEEALPSVVASALAGGAAHVLLFSHSHDDAADLGDVLAGRGFTIGRPGESDSMVWLGLEALAARDAVSSEGIDPSTVATISASPPLDADGLDRRHGGGWASGTVLLEPREEAHLRSLAREAGYELDSEYEPPPEIARRRGAMAEQVEEALSEADLVPYAVLLEPLFRRHGATQVAAALAAILGRKAPGRPGDGRPASSALPRPPAWAHLFLSVGRKDEVAARDLLGAIIGEAGVDASQVGKIEVKDAFSRVEVHDDVAGKVISALNGTSIRGRSIRADFDRSDDRSRESGPGRAARGRRRAGP